MASMSRCMGMRRYYSDSINVFAGRLKQHILRERRGRDSAHHQITY